ncbi:MAG: divalent-cation tolerance protein CutA [Proteobacteria bacterium]|nr:divalent-cation tolerance protein CutA [Pseudomonadota bacterium]
MKNQFVIITTTYPYSFQGKRLAKKMTQILLEKKLAACIQFLKVRSHYLWEEKICHELEILITIKSKKSHYKKIEKIILENHCYKIPQIIQSQITDGLESYLAWLDINTTATK